VELELRHSFSILVISLPRQDGPCDRRNPFYNRFYSAVSLE
jgi:hypothetical protein